MEEAFKLKALIVETIHDIQSIEPFIDVDIFTTEG